MAWYWDPDFVAARNYIIPPGGRISYVELPPQGSVPWDVTDFVYGQATWSPRHMPNILYRLRSGDDWVEFKRRAKLPGQKRDSQGRLLYEEWPSDPNNPRQLLDFEVLPDRIGSREHWWRLEAYRRLDPRIRWQDISMRIYPDERPSVILLRSRVSRPRIRFCMMSWFETPNSDQKTNDTILKSLTPAQIRNNTTRGSTPGLIDPSLGRAGGRVYLPDEGPENDTESSESSAASSEADCDGYSEAETREDKKSAKRRLSNMYRVKDELEDSWSSGSDESPARKRRHTESAQEFSPAASRIATAPPVNPRHTISFLMGEPPQDHDFAGSGTSYEQQADPADYNDQDIQLRGHHVEPTQHSTQSAEQTVHFTSVATSSSGSTHSWFPLASPIEASHYPQTFTQRSPGLHGPYGLPLDSRNFDYSGSYVPDGDFAWQIEEAVRWRSTGDSYERRLW